MTGLRLRVLALVVFVSAAGLLRADGGSCGVRVIVTDNYGNPVPMAKIRISGVGADLSVAPGVLFSSECGLRTVSISAPGFAPEKVGALLDQSEQLITIALRLGALEGAPPTWSILGEIASGPGVERVRVAQLFGLYSVDVPLTKAREFRVANIECGSYLVVLMGPRACLGTKVISVSAATGRVARLHLAVPDSDRSPCSSLIMMPGAKGGQGPIRGKGLAAIHSALGEPRGVHNDCVVALCFISGGKA